MAFTLLTGYPGQVWLTLRSTLAYAQGQLSTASQSAAALTAQIAAETYRNGRDGVTVSLLSTALASLYDRLSYALTLPLNVPQFQIDLVGYRVATIQAATISIQTLLPTLRAPAVVFPQGQPAVSDPLLLEWLASFDFEGDLGGALDGVSTNAIVPQALAMAEAWAAVYLALNGAAVPGSVVDAVEIMALSSFAAYESLAGAVFTSGVVSATTAWNLMVASPSITKAAWSMVDDPTSAAWQQISAMRYLVGTTLNRLYALVFSLRQAIPATVRLTQVRQSDTLMRIAARELGDFERFQEIAALNKLIPPYIAAQASFGVVTPGSQIFLPTSGTAADASAGTVPPSYEVNYLGVDVYYGPLNQPMAAWTGDFQRIVGYQNFAFSLGRRLQTTLGSFLFHTNFGSRIPPEVGAIALQSTAGHLGAYAKSAILSDPRTFSVPALTVTIGANYAIQIASTVQPNGSSGSGTDLNEVIQPTG